MVCVLVHGIDDAGNCKNYRLTFRRDEPSMKQFSSLFTLTVFNYCLSYNYCYMFINCIIIFDHLIATRSNAHEDFTPDPTDYI